MKAPSTWCMIYNVIFCARRFAVVLSFFYLRDDPVKFLYGFLLIQTCYFIYLILCMPHSENEFNILELFNEGLIILILYTLLGFTATSVLSAEAQWTLGYVTIVLISAVVIVNLAMMVYQTFRRIKFYFAMKNASKQCKKLQKM